MGSEAQHPILTNLLVGRQLVDRPLVGRPVVDEDYYETDQVLTELNFPTPPQQFVVPPEEEPANQFKVMVNMRNFSHSQIGAKIEENHIVVTATHPERIDKHGYITRQFTRGIPLPADVDINQVTALLYRNGVLVVKGPRTGIEARSPLTRTLTIQLQEPVPKHLDDHLALWMDYVESLN